MLSADSNVQLGTHPQRVKSTIIQRYLIILNLVCNDNNWITQAHFCS